MTGTLQNPNAERFFLTRYRPEFHAIFGIKNSLCQTASSFCQSIKQMLTCRKSGSEIRDFN